MRMRCQNMFGHLMGNPKTFAREEFLICFPLNSFLYTLFPTLSSSPSSSSTSAPSPWKMNLDMFLMSKGTESLIGSNP